MRNIDIANDRFELSFDSQKGCFTKLRLHDGQKMHDLIYSDINISSIKGIYETSVNIHEESQSVIRIEVIQKSKTHKITAFLEVYLRGYVVCTFSIETLEDNNLDRIEVGVPLVTNPVFTNTYQIKHTDKDDMRRYNRATSVIFSTDKRPVTNSIDFILESVNDGKKICIDTDAGRFLGWEIEDESLSLKGGTYSNRWCIHVSKINDKPSKVRGQRIYHWYGYYPTLPTLDMLDEMVEYGCSILILHMPSFKWIDGSVPIEEEDFIDLIARAHDYGIKMMFYIQPILISQKSPKHTELEQSLNDNGKFCWHSLKDTQIVFYVPNEDYDCDELCLRCEDAYDYVKTSVLNCYKKYNFDGLYIDFAWPSIAICNDKNHSHKEGLFNFYDYHKMMREFREVIGPDGIMIGHGGSLLVSSDYAEGFDACLTGEGQKDMLPDVIGVQTGTAPTLWTMHRRKEKQFRSRDAMHSIIREGLTPHIGLGILGKSIMASLDPAHTPHFIALWQIWRAFPIQNASFYNYLTTESVKVDNEEIAYSMYITPQKQVLLIISNGGGPEAESVVSVEVNINLNIDELKLNKTMSHWRLRGTSYEKFRISREADIIDGFIMIPEIAINEFIGIILTAGDPPDELVALERHLEGRFDRLPEIYKNRMQRLKNSDKLIEEFNQLDVKNMSEEEFMKNRTME